MSATLWPSHKHVEVEEGDVVIVEGAYTRNQSVGDDGEKRTYHNLSVNRIAVLAKSDSGTKPETTSSDDDGDAPDDDNIPF